MLLCQSYLTWHSFEFRAMAIFCCYGRFNLLNKILTFMMISVDVKQPLVHQARVKRIKGSSLSISPPLPKRHVTQRANGSCLSCVAEWCMSCQLAELLSFLSSGLTSPAPVWNLIHLIWHFGTFWMVQDVREPVSVLFHLLYLSPISYTR